MHFARGFFDLEKGPCNLQEGFSTPENVPAICERVFQPRKTPLQFAWTFSAAIQAANPLAGFHLLVPKWNRFDATVRVGCATGRRGGDWCGTTLDLPHPRWDDLSILAVSA